jgi:hypothetical protein
MSAPCLLVRTGRFMIDNKPPTKVKAGIVLAYAFILRNPASCQSLSFVSALSVRIQSSAPSWPSSLGAIFGGVCTGVRDGTTHWPS